LVATIKLARRKLIVGAVSLGFGTLPSDGSAAPGIIPIAIRWDPWYSQVGTAGQAQKPLSPEKWHSRLPWFSDIRSPTDVVSVGTQADMDAELTYASNAGIKCFAYDWFASRNSNPQSRPLSQAWTYHQASPNRSLVNWCPIISLSAVGSIPFNSGAWQADVDEWVEHMASPNYQKIKGRPLVFFMWADADLAWFGHDIANFSRMIRYWRDSAASAGIGDPRFIVMAGLPSRSAAILDRTNCDSISNYIPSPLTMRREPGSWEALVADTQAHWAAQARTGVDCVPIAITGWDPRPRIENPEPFSDRQQTDANRYFETPTDSQVAALLQAAVEFINTHPKVCSTRAMLIYSWSECSEGGNCMIPTIGKPPPSSLLTAVARVLK
jgi:hypothetical protein